MKIDNLRHFLTVARTGNMKRAAEESYLTPQNLNLIIKNIEKEIGTQLFVRTNRGSILTEKGESFVKTAQTIIDAYDDFINDSKAKKQNVFELYTTAVLSDMVKDIIEPISEQKYFLSILEYDFNKLCTMLENKQHGIYLIPLYDMKTLRHLTERKDKIVLARDDKIITICHKNHPLIHDGVYQGESLDPYSIIASGYNNNIGININDLSLCKKMMKKNYMLYQSSSIIIKKGFQEQDEWVILKSIEKSMEFVIFLLLDDKAQQNFFTKTILPYLKALFQT